MARKPTDTVKLQLRLPEGLRRRLAYLARRSGRSMNNEIVHLLTRAFTFAEPSGEIPSKNEGAMMDREEGGKVLVMNFDGKLYRFVAEDTADFPEESREPWGRATLKKVKP